MATTTPWQLRLMRPEALDALYSDHIRHDFPSAERPSLPAMHRHLSQGLQDIFIMHNEQEDAAYAVCAEANGIVLVTLLAVFAGSRGGGRGSALLRLLKEHYAASRAILLEVEDPEDAADAADRAVRERRISFYERAGYIPLENIVNCSFGVRLLMLALPLTDSPEALRRSAVADIQAVYHRILPEWLWSRVITTDNDKT